MNGAHDLGGKHGFGPIDQSQTEDFQYLWEQRVFGLTLACGMLGHWNLDQSRYARESAEPAHYLSSTYYEHWLYGLESLLLEKNLLSESELKNYKSESEVQNSQAISPAKAEQIITVGAPTLLTSTKTAAFSVDDKVVVSTENPKSHTRAPSYIKGVAGTIVKLHGPHVYADEHAATGKKIPQHLYSVKFNAQSIWGDSAEQNSYVFIDLFEPYLLTLEEHQAQILHDIEDMPLDP